ncbi:YjbH domain-containing protein [candidate division KSB1 bacterium]|nr:YjbH domain-containing protein [candidate division KSB1 bacterium]
MKLNIHYISILVLLIPFHLAQAISNDFNDRYQLLNKSFEDIQSRLVHYGFENIAVGIDRNNDVWIEYENRQYRYELTALKEILTYATQHFSDFDSVTVIPLHRNIRLLSITCSMQDLQAFQQFRISSQEFTNKIRLKQNNQSSTQRFYQTEKQNSSFLRTDIVLAPGYKVQFSRPNDPAQLQFSFAPELNIQLGTGLLFRSQFVVPIYDEFATNNMKPYFGATYLNQFYRLPLGWYVSGSIGHFTYNRNGTAIQFLKSLTNGRFMMSGRLDYTTASDYWDKNYDLHYFLKSSYYFRNVDFATHISCGKFLFNDFSWRLDIMRSFGEIDLGFMMMTNQEIKVLTGLHISIPFPAAKQGRPTAFRIIVPRNLVSDYRYLPYDSAYILETGTNIQAYFQKLTPIFIKNNIEDLREK